MLTVFIAMAGCALRPRTAAPVLEPVASGPVWPSPPNVPRYAFAGVLIGERNFLAPDQEKSNTVRSALAWVAGLLIGEPTYAELQRPVSGMTDKRGWIYVVDASHKAVVVFDMTGHRLRFWRRAAENVPFKSPVVITADGRGGFLVTDAELGEVFRLGPDGQPLGRFGKAILGRPTGVARDDATGRIYVADTKNHDIKIFDDDGTLVDTLGARGTDPGMFNAPTHLLFRNGRLYVADTFNFRIQVFDRSGDGRLTFGRLGLFVGNMTRPKGVAVGGDGRIYVIESYYDHLLVFDRSGRLLLPIGGTGSEIGRFYLPSGVWTDDFGRVYVADMFNGRIVVFKELTDVGRI
ncbi:MAG: hypothetical protein ACE5FR_04645 [Rhodospirillales bacterium]